MMTEASVVCGRCSCIEACLYCWWDGAPLHVGQAVIFSNKYESSLDFIPAPFEWNPECHCVILAVKLDGLQVMTGYASSQMLILFQTVFFSLLPTS